MCNFKDDCLMDLVYSSLENESIFNLLTKLCEKYAAPNSNIFPNDNVVKSLRSKCYDILLLKKNIQRGGVEGLESTDDPLCHLLAWEFLLRTRYNNFIYADKLKNVYEEIKKLNINDDSFQRTIFLLISLKNPPSNKNDGVLFNNQIYPFLENSKFIPEPLSAKIKYSDKDFHLEGTISKQNQIGNLKGKDPLPQCCDQFEINDNFKSPRSIFSDEESCLSQKNSNQVYNNDEDGDKSGSDDVWDIACKSSISDRRTWESAGIAEPKKELPFATEASSNVSIWMQNLKTSYIDNLIAKDLNATPNSVINISYTQFVKDVKYLLVGITSKTFQLSDEGELYFVPNTVVQGLSITAANCYSHNMLYCGSCYKGLADLTTTDCFSGKYKQEGHIFKEVCESIKRYLSYYRVAILSLPDTTNLLALQEYVRNLQEHFKVLTSICKVGPFKQDQRTPHGMELLNYFYQKILSAVKKDILMVLYAVFYPCCQLYYHRFLGQWILEGDLNDPSAEFFIETNPKYLSSRGRTYWTRSYSIREDVVPDFLIELKDSILACGKAMNLLKLCVPNSPLCCYILEKKPTLFTSCLTAEQLLTLEQDTYTYYLNAISKCGPHLSLEKLIEKKKFEENIFLGLIAKKRAITLKRIELERQEKIKSKLERKRNEIIYLRNQYDEALARKKCREIEQLRREMQTKEAVMKMEMIEMKIFQEEAQNLIDYYNELYKAADKYRASIEKNTENIRKLNLEDSSNPSCNHSPISREDVVIPTSHEISEVFLSASDDLQSKPDATLSDNSEVFVAALDYISNSATVIENGSPKASKKQLHLDSDMIIEEETVEQVNYKERQSACLLNRERSRSSQLENMMKENDIGLPKFTFNFAWSTPENIKSKSSKDLVKNQVEIFEEAKKNKLKFLEQEYGEKSSLEDIINANLNNTKESSNSITIQNKEDKEGTALTRTIQENFESARRNKKKVLETELGLYNYSPKDSNANVALTDKKIATKNDNDSPSIDWCIFNEEYVKNNHPELAQNNVDLTLNLRSVKPDSKGSKTTPMSVDTPSSDFSLSKRSYISITSEDLLDSIQTPTSEEDLKLEPIKQEPVFKISHKSSSVFDIAGNLEKNVLPDRILPDEAQEVSANCLKLYLQQSVAIPLKMQTNLVNNELLKFFVEELRYLEHLISLRNYFFLLDGQFAKNLSDKLFEKLYSANFPIDLVNWRTLHVLVQTAFDGHSSNAQDNSDRLSFRINNLPKTFDLTDPEVLDCISLTYKITWPLNILIPSDILNKYDDVFKLLLKFRRVSWVLQKMFSELKCLIKRTEAKKVPLLLLSTQYRRVHQCRHIMTHFVQTLQNYIHGVLETSWQFFEEQLSQVSDLDMLYEIHTSYLKNILFMCLLNQKSLPLRKVIQKILSVILKFYDYLRSRQWICEDGIFKHPNFAKLEELFKNFEEIVAYFFKVGMKVVRSGYQKDLLQLLESLNINEYYTKNTNIQSNNISTQQQ